MSPHRESRELDKGELFRVLSIIDRGLEGMQRKIKLYSVGGTTLLFYNLKTSKDLDFIVSGRDFKALSLSGVLGDLEFREGVRIDLFPDGEMPGYKYDKYFINAIKINTKYNNLEIYKLDDTDYLLTKALAGRVQDYKDIERIGITKKSVPKDELLSRFGQIKPTKEKEGELKKRFNRFVRELYGE